MLILAPTAASEDRCAGTAVSGAANPLDAPALHTSTTYAINGTAAGKRSYVVFQPQVSGEYQLFLGGPSVGARVVGEPPTTIRSAKGCMHTVATYELVAGERYELELAPIPAGHALLLRLDAPVEEDHVAYRDATLREPCSVQPAGLLLHVSSWRSPAGDSV